MFGFRKNTIATEQNNDLKRMLGRAENDIISTAKREISAKFDEYLSGRMTVPVLEDAVAKLKKELEQLKLKRKIEEEDVKHLVKIQKESQELDYRGKELDLKLAFADKEKELLAKFHRDTLLAIEKSQKEQLGMYTKIMDRLPNVNMNIKGKRDA